MQAEAPLCGPGNRGRSTTNSTPHTRARVRCDSDHHTDATSSLYLQQTPFPLPFFIHPPHPLSSDPRRSPHDFDQKDGCRRACRSLPFPPFSASTTPPSVFALALALGPPSIRYSPRVVAPTYPYKPHDAPAQSQSRLTYVSFVPSRIPALPNLRKLSHDQYSSRLSLSTFCHI